MLLTHLSLTNFRNFARLDLDIPSGPVLLVGGNAQGKTSLLEAIYFLATFVSHHATSDRQLINFLIRRDPLAVARIVADFSLTGQPSSHIGQKKHRLEVRLIQETNRHNRSPRLRKEVLLDGVKQKLNQVIGLFNAVLFLPEMLRVVDGPPEERRRYLNLAIGQVSNNYVLNLSAYRKTLAQRNALLKQLHDRNEDYEQLAFWDERLADLGANVIFERIRAIKEIEHLAAQVHSQLTRGQEVLRLAYQPAYDPLPKSPTQYSLPLEYPLDRSGLSLDDIRAGFLERLLALRGEEIARSVTTVGPHRDELRFISNRVDVGIYGSRGQGRTVVLSLKLAEIAWMKEKTGQWPVLLLDEVLAELDPERRADLLSRLLASEQAMLTTTDLDLFSKDFIQQAQIWSIQAGRITMNGQTGV